MSKKHRVDVIAEIPGDVEKDKIREVADEFQSQLEMLGARVEIGVATKHEKEHNPFGPAVENLKAHASHGDGDGSGQYL